MLRYWLEASLLASTLEDIYIMYSSKLRFSQVSLGIYIYIMYSSKLRFSQVSLGRRIVDQQDGARCCVRVVACALLCARCCVRVVACASLRARRCVRVKCACLRVKLDHIMLIILEATLLASMVSVRIRNSKINIYS